MVPFRLQYKRPEVSLSYQMSLLSNSVGGNSPYPSLSGWDEDMWPGSKAGDIKEPNWAGSQKNSIILELASAWRCSLITQASQPQYPPQGKSDGQAFLPYFYLPSLAACAVPFPEVLIWPMPREVHTSITDNPRPCQDPVHMCQKSAQWEGPASTSAPANLLLSQLLKDLCSICKTSPSGNRILPSAM